MNSLLTRLLRKQVTKVFPKIYSVGGGRRLFCDSNLPRLFLKMELARIPFFAFNPYKFEREIIHVETMIVIDVYS